MDSAKKDVNISPELSEYFLGWNNDF